MCACVCLMSRGFDYLLQHFILNIEPSQLQLCRSIDWAYVADRTRNALILLFIACACSAILSFYGVTIMLYNFALQ